MVEVSDAKEMQDVIRRYVMSNLAREVNDEVIRRLPGKESDSLSPKEGQKGTRQRVKNEYFAYTKASDDFTKVHVDFFVRLGNLQGVHKIQIDRHFRRKPRQ